MKKLTSIILLSGTAAILTAAADLPPIDYSYCGYKASADTIPTLSSSLIVTPIDGDNTQAIQDAIDLIGALAPNAQGFRGVVQLKEGTYRLQGRLRINQSGIVLRGMGAEKTRLLMQGVDREPAIALQGQPSAINRCDTLPLCGQVHAGDLKVASTTTISHLKAGTEIEIVHPSTQSWIEKYGCQEYGGGISALGWKPGDVDVRYRRTLENDGNLMLDAPLYMSFNADEEQAYALVYPWSDGYVSECGIEDLSIEAEVTSPNPKDEQHLWTGISIDKAHDCWVRRVNFRNLAGSGVIVEPKGQRITIQDCLYLHPVGELAGHRRNAFYVFGQQVLVQRCLAEQALHAFAAGWAAPGPNAFVQCEAREALDYSGGIDAWATGLLFDIVDIDGHDIVLKNIGQDHNGAGWTAANSTLWQCSAAVIHCYAPDADNTNRAYGVWSQFQGNGIWVSSNEHVRPRSLFYAQLEKRLGKKCHPILLETPTEATSSPTPELAMQLAELARTTPKFTLEMLIRQQQAISADGYLTISKATQQQVSQKEKKLARQKPSATEKKEPIRIAVTNGHLTGNGALLVGGRYSTPWWNGKIRPPFIQQKAQPALTRFVPDRTGLGFTDHIDSVIAYLDKTQTLVFDQWYGLWYDRRRDDHERIRRRDADCWTPFYEQPWARSGKGAAWEGLSRYDLSQPNIWYYYRLQEFARKAPNHLLFLEHYFQHNILEAGAHWVDCPWRPVNNINQTVFPEPVPFAGDKRVFVAEWFYDEENATMRQLHRQYIRQNLEQFKDHPNVVHLISSEYTGPYHFTRFWLECIQEWEQETGQHPLIALACTKDVQDSLLADKKLSQVIDIIQIQYWFYKQADKRNPNTLWAPAGGQNMAPRQQQRKMPNGKTTFLDAYQAVSEYRQKFPDKAVTFYAQNYPDLGWAILMAGGSCCQVDIQDEEILTSLASMQIAEVGTDAKALSNGTSGLIYFTHDGEAVLSGMKPGKHALKQLHRDSKCVSVGTITVPANGTCRLTGKSNQIYYIL
ncbi:MAG: pectate lyase [Bacteroidales bacterium]|nr:pectate lyase [Bacteroidales bacterium]